MNPGISEEAGQTARGLFDALKSQPATLALSVAQFAMLAYLFYVQSANNRAWEQNNEQRAELGKAIFVYQRETNQLLAHCQMPGEPPAAKP